MHTFKNLIQLLNFLPESPYAYTHKIVHIIWGGGQDFLKLIHRLPVRKNQMVLGRCPVLLPQLLWFFSVDMEPEPNLEIQISLAR